MTFPLNQDSRVGPPPPCFESPVRQPPPLPFSARMPPPPVVASDLLLFTNLDQSVLVN